MKKGNLQEAFRTLFKTVLNLQTTLDDVKHLEGGFSSVDFNNTKQTENLLKSTKDVVNKLQNELKEIGIYFNKCESLTDDLKQLRSNNCDLRIEGVDNGSETTTHGDDVEGVTKVTNKSKSISSRFNNRDLEINDNDSTKNVDDVDEAIKTIDNSKSISFSSIKDSGDDDVDNRVKERDVTENSEDMDLPKVFIKCVDIKMLMKPDTVSPKIVSNESVLIISDSENESDNIRTKRKSPIISKASKPISNTTKVSDSETTNGRSSRRIANSIVNRKSKFEGKFKKRRRTSFSSSSSSSSSDSSDTDEVKNNKQTTRKSPVKKVVRFCNNLQDFNDRYFKSYVRLSRVQCEQLKDYYLNENKLKESESASTIEVADKSNSLLASQSIASESVCSEEVNNSISSPEKDCETVGGNILTDTSLKAQSISTKSKKSSDKDSLSTASEKGLENSTGKEINSSDINKSTNEKEMNAKSSRDKDQSSDSDSDFETFSKKNSDKEKLNKLSKKKNRIIDSESDSDDDSKKKKLDEDFEPENNKESSSSNNESEKEESDEEEEETTNRNKRKRIKRMSDSSDDELSTRKTIRRMIAHDSLTETTKQAEKAEHERKARIAERQKKYNAIFDEDQPIDAVIDKLVLDFNDESKREILSVNSDLVKMLKPHQAKGIQFMWDACFESVERTKKTAGSGSILAHCMGLGKTLQVIALIHTLLANEEKTGIKTVLVVCPVNTVLNWVAEFKKWLDDVEPEVEVLELATSKQLSGRQYQIEHWAKNGGVLIIGYDMFRNLTNTASKKFRKSMRTVFQTGLVDPGADLVICDEGHLLKNEKSNLSIAMNRVRTARRIVLTGTPMQNNLKEYYCMVQFVKPNLLGTYKEYLNRFVNPITNGQYTDSTPHDISIMRRRSHVLHKMLDGVIQRKDYSVLMPYLPPKYEYVLFLTLTEVQIELYQHYLKEYARRPVESNRIRTSFLFTDFQEFQRICTHPRVLLNKSIENDRKAMLVDSESDSEGSLKDFIDDDSDEKCGSKNNSSSSSDGDSSESEKSVKAAPKRLTRNAASEAGINIEEEVVQSQHEQFIQDKWWSKYCSGDQLDNIGLSSKLYLLFEILQQCEVIGDKLLVFSQSLYSLDIIEYFLARIDEATQNGDTETIGNFKGSWSLGLDYFRLDGSSSCDNRSVWCKHFNSPNNTRARLFLISTRAGGIGINLTGANRVIIFDVSWNPSHDVQSIYRVYRFGQTKPCYVYRFVTNGTMEMKVYERQVTKQAISKRVIDEQQIDRHYNQNDLAELYNFDPKPEDQPTPLVPKDVLLAELLQQERARIYKYHEHQTLLENKEDEVLNEDERKAAWEEFEHEKTARANLGGGLGYIRNVPISAINAALYRILRKDNSSWSHDVIEAAVPEILKQLQDQVATGNMLMFNHVLNEIKIMHSEIQHQQRLQNMVQQQAQLMQQRYLQSLASTSNKRGQVPFPSSSEIVELND